MTMLKFIAQLSSDLQALMPESQSESHRNLELLTKPGAKDKIECKLIIYLGLPKILS
jgi:hypothetical protein